MNPERAASPPSNLSATQRHWTSAMSDSQSSTSCRLLCDWKTVFWCPLFLRLSYTQHHWWVKYKQSTSRKIASCWQTFVPVFDRFNAFHAETKKPLHKECGFIRMQPGANRVAFIIAQNSGSCVHLTGGTLVLDKQAAACISGICCYFERIIPDVQRPGM